jgi:hypothetical protein
VDDLLSVHAQPQHLIWILPDELLVIAPVSHIPRHHLLDRDRLIGGTYHLSKNCHPKNNDVVYINSSKHDKNAMLLEKNGSEKKLPDWPHNFRRLGEVPDWKQLPHGELLLSRCQAETALRLNGTAAMTLFLEDCKNKPPLLQPLLALPLLKGQCQMMPGAGELICLPEDTIACC